MAILDSLSRHMRANLDRLGDALNATLSDADRVVLADLLRRHDGVDRCIAALDRHLDAGLAAHVDQLRLLQTIPGIVVASAAAIPAEMGPDPATVFGAADGLAAWTGVCPGNHESAGKRRSAHARSGAKHLRALLLGCAHGAARARGCSSTPTTAHWRRGVAIGTIVATAHKLVRAIFAVLRDGARTATPRSTTRPCWSSATRHPGSPSCASAASSNGAQRGTLTVNWATVTANGRCSGAQDARHPELAFPIESGDVRLR